MSENYKLIKGKRPDNHISLVDALKKYPAYKEVISSIAQNIKHNSLESAELLLSIDKVGIKISFFNKAGTDKIELSVKDSPEMGKISGTPYLSNWNGYFYRLSANKKLYVKNGQRVKQGVPIGVVFVNKNEQFVLSAPASGRIHFPDGDKAIEQGRPIKKKITLLFYLDP